MNKREMWSASGTEFLRIRYGKILQVCTTTCLHLFSSDGAERERLTVVLFIYLFISVCYIVLCACAYAFTFTLFMIAIFCSKNCATFCSKRNALICSSLREKSNSKSIVPLCECVQQQKIWNMKQNVMVEHSMQKSHIRQINDKECAPFHTNCAHCKCKHTHRNENV